MESRQVAKIVWIERSRVSVGASTALTDTVYRAGMEIELVDGAESQRTIYYGMGGAFRIVGGVDEGLFFRHTDHLGSTSAALASLSDENGDKVAGSDVLFAPFGEVRTGDLSDLTDRGYTGQKLDRSTDGLMYYGARYYLPELRRFISADTIVPSPVNPQAFNRYSYVLNSPLNFTDPSGHVACPADMSEDECAFSSRPVETRTGVPVLRGGGGSYGTPSTPDPISEGNPVAAGPQPHLGDVVNAGSGCGCLRVPDRGSKGASGGQGGSIAGSDPLVAEDFYQMTISERLIWLEQFQSEVNSMNPQAGVGNYFAGIHGFIYSLWSTGLGHNSYLNWTDAGVLQQLQNGYLDYLGLPIACSSLASSSACQASAGLWSNFIVDAQNPALSPAAITASYGTAEGAGAHYGTDIAYAASQPTPGITTELEFKALLFAADSYRAGQTIGGGILAQAVPSVFHPTTDAFPIWGINFFNDTFGYYGMYPKYEYYP